MSARGFKQVPKGADVTLSYYNVTSNDVDLKKLDEIEKAGGGTAPTIMRARMLIVMRSAARAAAALVRDHPRARRPGQLDATVTRVAERLFATYPGSKPR